MDALEHKGERALKLFENSLDKTSEVEALLRLRIPNVFEQDRHRLSVSLTLEFESFLLKNETEFSVVGDNSVVDDDEFVSRIGSDRVAVDWRWRAVCGPARMCDRALIQGCLLHVNRGLCDELAESGDLANLLEEYDLIGSIAVDADACFSD